MGLRRFMQSRRHTSLLVVGKCNAFVHFEENQSPDVVQQLQGRRWVKVHSRYRCQWTSDFADKKRGEEFLWCPVQTHTRQDNKHSHVANRPFICWNFCNKTHKKFSKICQNRFSEVKETINFKNLRGAAPNPAGGLTAPPPPPTRPPAGFLLGIHIKIIPVTPLKLQEMIELNQPLACPPPPMGRPSFLAVESFLLAVRQRLMMDTDRSRFLFRYDMDELQAFSIRASSW